MDTIPQRLTSKPSFLLTQLAVHARRLVSDAFAATGARGYHYRILATLEEFGPASQAELGRHGLIDRKDIVTALNELVELGLVDRSPDPDHGRRNRISITQEGGRQLQRMDGALDQVQDELLAPLSARERQTLTRLLGEVLAHHSGG
jgi:DNA-binding MarR family transcriptional regulator